MRYDNSYPSHSFDPAVSRLKDEFQANISNAVKFTPDGGTIEVSLGREGSYAIADTGPGITTEFLPHVLERFTQADRSTTRKHGGLGLGLAIVRHLVELHGGTVEARNREGNEGAIFTVTLPASS